MTESSENKISSTIQNIAHTLSQATSKPTYENSIARSNSSKPSITNSSCFRLHNCFQIMVVALNSASTMASGHNSHQTSNSTFDNCALKYRNLSNYDANVYCNWTWDKFLCWPPTPAGTLVRQRCPPGHGLDVTKFAERRCSPEGRWEGKHDHPNGWTNYTPCFTPEMWELMNKIYANGNNYDAEMKIDIAERTRILEIVGFTLSLFALILSLIIFFSFRGLRNNRTRIHKNLFFAMVIQVVIRLILYLDQAIIRSAHEIAGNGSRHGIDNTPYLCEASYVLLEYARTAMFTWMFIEGLYLHNVVTVTVFQGRFPHMIYLIIGWGAPIIMTTIWAIITAKYYGQQKCWWGYNLTPYYWIVEGPRLAVILLNFLFLLNIIRVLVVKLRQSHTSDIEQVRKAVRAAVVLLPLLGITNLLLMTAPLEKAVWEFALWSYITHFLASFQGFFIALIYCFMNGEVRAALMKSLSVYMSLRGRGNWPQRRASMFSAAYNTAPETDGQCNESLNRQEPSPTTRLRQHHHEFNRSPSPNSYSSSWMTAFCFRGQKVLKEPPVHPSAPPETCV